mmetsp:Transcript_51569/g.167438  ORF Transcript_51569/g.167438 Transcript_51569/m.167438 type:complete len:201 (+) Transcript_51569:619-1221(+)
MRANPGATCPRQTARPSQLAPPSTSEEPPRCLRVSAEQWVSEGLPEQGPTRSTKAYAAAAVRECISIAWHATTELHRHPPKSCGRLQKPSLTSPRLAPDVRPPHLVPQPQRPHRVWQTCHPLRRSAGRAATAPPQPRARQGLPGPNRADKPRHRTLHHNDGSEHKRPQSHWSGHAPRKRRRQRVREVEGQCPPGCWRCPR